MGKENTSAQLPISYQQHIAKFEIKIVPLNDG